MRPKPTEEDGRRALRRHAVDKARLARERYGPRIDFEALGRMLRDREIVRHPTLVRFDATRLSPGECAHAEALSNQPVDGFVLHVHPCFEQRQGDASLLVAYQLVRINYGNAATPDLAEVFGSELLGIDQEQYYQRLCTLADELAEGVAAEA